MPTSCELDRLKASVTSNVSEELELFDVLVVTDAGDALQAKMAAGYLPGARVASVTDPAAPLSDPWRWPRCVVARWYEPSARRPTRGGA